jgi:hypothetical protein
MSFLEEFVRKAAASGSNETTPEIYREAAFKRGFHHGVITLMEAVSQYLPREVLASLQKYEAEVREWRYARRQSVPPEPEDIT